VVGKQAYECALCHLALHKKCHELVVGTCPGAEATSATVRQRTEQAQLRFSINVPHQFKSHNYKRPTFCDHCGSMLFGLWSQGMQCKSCKCNVHKRCAAHAGNLCGLNQAQLATELAKLGLSASDLHGSPRRDVVRGTKDPDGAASAPASPAAAAAAGGGSSSPRPAAPTLSASPAAPARPPAASSSPAAVASAAAAGGGSGPKIGPEHFTYLKVLGKGSFGKVLLAEHKTSGHIFAVKVLKKDVLVEDDDIECAIAERNVSSLGHRHPFLVALHSCFQTPVRWVARGARLSFFFFFLSFLLPPCFFPPRSIYFYCRHALHRTASFL
jgi:novel protein kinase C epsilon type